MYHKAVMFRECIDGLNIRDNGIIVDATTGGAMHSEGILKANPTARLYCFDQDPDAISFAKKRLEKFADRVTFIQSNFSELRTQLAYNKVNRIDGILFDLGISSHQIDDAARGFSFSQVSPLDMRMDQSRDLTAAYILNNYDLNHLTRIFREYGEEKASRKIANLVVNNRKSIDFQNSNDLNSLLEKNMRMNPKFFTKMLSRIYQALRIEVNGEMDVLKSVLKDALYLLNPGGRIVVESYHSLEDKIIKDFFRYEALDCTCLPSSPICNCGKISTLKIINKKPITASEDEIIENPRSRSAKLRIAEKKAI